MAGFTNQKQAFHDKVASTLVVKGPKFSKERVGIAVVLVLWLFVFSFVSIYKDEASWGALTKIANGIWQMLFQFSSKLNNSDIILICYNENIENDNSFIGLDNIKNNIDKFNRLYNFLNESNIKDEELSAVLERIEQILQEWSNWNVKSEKAFLFFFEIIKTCYNKKIRIFDVLKKIKSSGIEFYYQNLNDCLKETICLDYLIWNGHSFQHLACFAR